jgi:signal transduction histidine kinase
MSQVPTQSLLLELNHRIHSPLAAIRNALTLIGLRSTDPEVQRYLELAQREAEYIGHTLREARAEDVPVADRRMLRLVNHSRRAAA